MLTVRIGGRVFLGDPHPGISRGLIISPRGFQGWQGITSSRREALARAVQHGEYDTPVYLGSRIVTMDGWIQAATDADLGTLSDSVTGMCSLGKTVMSVENQSSNRWAEGRVLTAECEDTGMGHSEFQVQLVFPDPRRYGQQVTLPEAGTAMAIAVFHRGNFPAYPLVEIPNAPAAYTITSPGGTFIVTNAQAGGLHAVDLRTGRVYRQGIEMDDVGQGDLWAVPPGEVWEHVLSAPGRTRIKHTYV